MPLTTTISYPIVAKNKPREGAYFNFPKTPRILTVRNQNTGETFDVIFRVTSYSSQLTTNSSSSSWDEGKDFSAPRGGGCTFYTPSWGGGSGSGSWINLFGKHQTTLHPVIK